MRGFLFFGFIDKALLSLPSTFLFLPLELISFTSERTALFLRVPLALSIPLCDRVALISSRGGVIGSDSAERGAKPFFCYLLSQRRAVVSPRRWLPPTPTHVPFPLFSLSLSLLPLLSPSRLLSPPLTFFFFFFGLLHPSLSPPPPPLRTLATGPLAPALQAPGGQARPPRRLPARRAPPRRLGPRARLAALSGPPRPRRPPPTAPPSPSERSR